MNVMKALSFILLLLCFAIRWTSAVAKIELFDGGSGLSSNTVTAIVKDNKGLMWIGTQNGLNVYAGYNFIRPYPELTNQPILDLAYDSVRNTMWVGTMNGVYVVRSEDGKVQRIATDTGWDANEMTALCVLPNHGAYVVYRSGALLHVGYDYQPRFILRLKSGNRNINQLLPSGDKLFFGAPDNDSAICILEVSSRTFQQRVIKNVHQPFQLGKSGDTLIVSGGNKQVVFLDLQTWADITPAALVGRKIELSTVQGQQLIAVTCGSYCGSASYYASTPDTVLEYDFARGATRNLTGVSNVFFGRQKYLSCYQDESGIVWIGTNVGMYKILPSAGLFDTVLYDPRLRISARAIVEEPNGDLYVGGSYGLYHYSANNQTWQWYLYTDPFSRTHAVLTTDLLDDGNYIYISSHGRDAFYRFNKERKQFELDFYKTGSKKYASYSLYRDADSVIWIGTRGGLMSYDPRTNLLQSHKIDFFTGGNCQVLDIKSSADGNSMWLASSCGVLLFNKHRGVLAQFNKTTTPALSSNDIYFVEEDSKGYLWLTTNGGGINLISPDRTSIRYLNREHNGLSSDIVYGMLTDDAGNVWFSTSNGLSCYYSAEDRFYNYFTIDGLCNDDFSYNSYLKGRDGKMYFGTINGVNSFYPEKILAARRQDVRLFVLPVSKWDEQTKSFTMISDFKGDGDEIILHTPSSSLVFNLGMTDYLDPVHNTFAYRILGLFDDWIPISGEPVLRLNGIPYGKYIVEVRGVTARGVAASNQLHFSIHVKKPFYNTVWFYMLVGCLIFLLLSVFFWFKYSNLKKMQRLRLQISSNLHDEVGGLLTSITLFSDNLRFSQNTTPENDSRLQKIASLSREATTTMSDILWAVDARNDMPGSLSERIREYAEERLLPLQVSLQVDMDDVSGRRKMPVVLRQQVYLIFKEAINNIVKHADVTSVEIEFRYRNKNSFLIRVVNDGVREARQGVRGQGLKNVQMRAKKIGAAMKQETNNGYFSIVVCKGDVT